MNGVEDAIREHRARVLAGLIGFLGDFDLAEEALADAMAIAAERWPREGVPSRPGAWLTTTARRRAIDRLRRERTLRRKLPALLPTESEPAMDDLPDDPIPDERLELIFTCCHPALSLEAQVALTLRTLGGLDTPDLARAFLVTPDAMKRRLTRAKTRIRGCGIPFRVPPAHLLPERLSAVLAVVYLIFNQGYGGGAELAEEALRLGRLLAVLMPDEPEALGLLALMELIHARRPSRFDSGGELVLLGDQDRTRWDRAAIQRGNALLGRARRRGDAGPYVLQAAIAAAHCSEPVDWPGVVALYEQLAILTGSPVVEVNRAVALAEAGRPADGLALLDAPALAGLQGYQYLHSTRGELLARMGRPTEARAAFERALSLAVSEPERRFLTRRRDQLPGEAATAGSAGGG